MTLDPSEELETIFEKNKNILYYDDLDDLDSDEFNPFKFVCDNCKHEHIFTEDEIEKTKQKRFNTQDEYFILCQKCKKWEMQPPIMVSFWWAFMDV